MPFKVDIPCFSFSALNVYDQKELQSYDIIRKDLLDRFDKIANNIVFGKEYRCDASVNADLMMLVLFFKMIAKEKAVSDIPCDAQYWSDTYCLEKIKKAFYCRGVIIDTLEDLWECWGMNQYLRDGIGSMRLEAADDCHPVFRVRWADGEDPWYPGT